MPTMRTLVVARLLATYATALMPQRTPQRGATRLASTPTDVTVLDHHLGGIMLGLDRVGGFLEAIAAMEPERVASDTFQYPKSLSDPDWDGSISINTYTDYRTLYGPFTVHTYREEWDSGTDIYATDAETGKDLMTYIVQCMRASGRYRGSLFDNDGDREDSERLQEMDEVEADYAGCFGRVGYTRRRPRGECSHAGLASYIAEILRGTTATVRTTSSTHGMRTVLGSGRRASPSD